MDVEPIHFTWKKLPDFVFESLGGKKVAKKLRKAAIKVVADFSLASSIIITRALALTPTIITRTLTLTLTLTIAIFFTLADSGG